MNWMGPAARFVQLKEGDAARNKHSEGGTSLTLTLWFCLVIVQFMPDSPVALQLPLEQQLLPSLISSNVAGTELTPGWGPSRCTKHPISSIRMGTP